MRRTLFVIVLVNKGLQSRAGDSGMCVITRRRCVKNWDIPPGLFAIQPPLKKERIGRAFYDLTLCDKGDNLCSDVTTRRFKMRMGLREANQRFSKAIKAVKAGKEVVLTERGKPIAVIKPLKPIEDEQAVIRRLEAEGILRSGAKSGKPMPVWRSPVRIKGKPMSETISEERDER
jgi:prevent-host-death family protein